MKTRVTATDSPEFDEDNYVVTVGEESSLTWSSRFLGGVSGSTSHSLTYHAPTVLSSRLQLVT
jgi:hypothetical protein